MFKELSRWDGSFEHPKNVKTDGLEKNLNLPSKIVFTSSIGHMYYLYAVILDYKCFLGANEKETSPTFGQSNHKQSFAK